MAQAGRVDAALAYRQAAGELRADPELWRALADEYARRGNWLAARDALERVVVFLPEDPAAHYQIGILLLPFDSRRAYRHLEYALNDPELSERARELRAIVAEVEFEPPAVQSARIGQALLALSYWPQAEQALSQAVNLDAADASAWAFLALTRAQQRKSGEIAIAQALARDPQSALVQYLVGLAYRAAGDLAAAQAALAGAATREPQNPAFALELGSTYRELGDLVVAEQWMQAAVALAPEAPRFLKALAMFYAEETFKLDGNGLPTLQAALDALPQDADLQAAYGWALFNTGDLAGAQMALDTALALAPDNPRALYYQGVTRLRQDESAAADLFARLLDHPNPQGFDSLARRALSQME